MRIPPASFAPRISPTSNKAQGAITHIAVGAYARFENVLSHPYITTMPAQIIVDNVKVEYRGHNMATKSIDMYIYHPDRSQGGEYRVNQDGELQHLPQTF
ncbi:MAG: hypothetical protein V4534_07970 [Myxococcota bacterium]